jgi:hypothetical protein
MQTALVLKLLSVAVWALAPAICCGAVAASVVQGWAGAGGRTLFLITVLLCWSVIVLMFSPNPTTW